MSVNRARPHVLVLPEDDANRQIAVGFELESTGRYKGNSRYSIRRVDGPRFSKLLSRTMSPQWIAIPGDFSFC